MRRSSSLQRRQIWMVLALVILLVIVSWSVVAIIDGVTHPHGAAMTPTPLFQHTTTP